MYVGQQKGLGLILDIKAVGVAMIVALLPTIDFSFQDDGWGN